MVRISLKGGVWKNNEDEVLKAGVMKYGKNNWSRVASLINGKTPKECKARWFEWLDPSIKKTEWTREEEEKLLQLAKIFPAQWRTIAPMLSRTAHQCIDHFRLLQDTALQRERAAADPTGAAAALAASATGVGARRLLPGEIDHAPETKPARPDPVDMDDEDKEMLQEVRARLANTKGKKATRKAREKHLEEAQRLAQLQKLRELRAAGIDAKARVKKKGNEIDYAAEIPFHHAAPAGPFDTAGDRERAEGLRAAAAAGFIGADVGQLNGESAAQREARERVKDAQRERVHRETALPALIQRLNAANDPAQIKARAPLALPAPQVSGQGLQALARAGALAAALADTARAAAAGALVTGVRGGVSDADHVMREVLTITKLQKGGDAAADDAAAAAVDSALKTGFTGVVAARTKTAAHTAAPLAAAAAAAAASAATGAAPGPRPKALAPRSAAAAAAAAAEQSRKRLRSLFAALPASEGEYQLVWPELPRLDARDTAAAAAATAGAGAGVTQLLHTASAGALAAAVAAAGDDDDDEDAEAKAGRALAARALAADRAVRGLPAPLPRALPRPTRVNAAAGAGVNEALAALAASSATVTPTVDADGCPPEVAAAVAAAAAAAAAALAAAADSDAANLARARAAVAAETVVVLRRAAAAVPAALTEPAAAAPPASTTGAVALPLPAAAPATAALKAHALSVAMAATAGAPAVVPFAPAAEDAAADAAAGVTAASLARARALVAAEVARAGVAGALPPVAADQTRGLYIRSADADADAAAAAAAEAASARADAVLRAEVAAAHLLCEGDALLFVPATKRFAVAATLAPAARAAAEAQAVALLRAQEARLRARADALEQRLGVVLGGYSAKMAAADKEARAAWAQLGQARTNAACYRLMLEQEASVTVGARVARLRAMVDAQKELEAALQAEYVKGVRALEDAVDRAAAAAAAGSAAAEASAATTSVSADSGSAVAMADQ